MGSDKFLQIIGGGREGGLYPIIGFTLKKNCVRVFSIIIKIIYLLLHISKGVLYNVMKK